MDNQLSRTEVVEYIFLRTNNSCNLTGAVLNIAFTNYSRNYYSRLFVEDGSNTKHLLSKLKEKKKQKEDKSKFMNIANRLRNKILSSYNGEAKLSVIDSAIAFYCN